MYAACCFVLNGFLFLPGGFESTQTGAERQFKCARSDNWLIGRMGRGHLDSGHELANAGGEGPRVLLACSLDPGRFLQWIAVSHSVISWPPSKSRFFFPPIPPPTAALSIIRCAVATGGY